MMIPDYKTLPSVSEVIDYLKDSNFIHNRYLTKIIRTEIKRFRIQIKNGKTTLTRQEILNNIADKIIKIKKGSIQNLINGTGIILHTGFGRAPISKALIEDAVQRLEGYVNLEFDLETGKRGDRNIHVEDHLTAMCNTESVIIVNNNAAAVLLGINTFAAEKEVIVSRGQLVEIGGSFRIPDIITKSSAILKEVGSTNRTHLKDYEKAINGNTGLILWVHTSNYRVEGFTNEVPLKELVALGKKYRIPVIADLGSGALEKPDFQSTAEYPVHEIVKSGVDLVTFSGDKLLGGPQAGIITGKTKLVREIKKNPLYRAVRSDKFTIFLLEQTLKTYHKKNVDEKNLTHFLFKRSRKELAKVAEAVLSGLDRKNIADLNLQVVDSFVEAGSGSLPVESIESVALNVNVDGISPSRLATYFRNLDNPVVGYVKGNTFYIDLKAVLPGQESLLINGLKIISGIKK